jgi:hypothetical protein
MESAAVRAAAVTVVTAGIIAALYYGQVMFIPIALAILISFVLAPVVRGFERLGLNRVIPNLRGRDGANAARGLAIEGSECSDGHSTQQKGLRVSP